jgi:hypothetical protein
VLEHLRDPQRLLRAIRPYLADDGRVICSIPNVKHWSVLLPLLVDDRFEYTDAGLLDRTHVHLFTLDEAHRMLTAAGLHVEQVSCHTVPMPPAARVVVDAAASLGADAEQTSARLQAYQYLIVARPD